MAGCAAIVPPRPGCPARAVGGDGAQTPIDTICRV
jgi:hypothetical protein